MVCLQCGHPLSQHELRAGLFLCRLDAGGDGGPFVAPSAAPRWLTVLLALVGSGLAIWLGRQPRQHRARACEHLLDTLRLRALRVDE